MSIHGILGEQTTDYPTEYSPETLYPIARNLGRDVIGWQDDKLAVGVDWWHAFELSWLNAQGVSQVAIARFAVPASSPFIVESKSLKLYLNTPISTYRRLLIFIEFKILIVLTEILKTK